MSQFSLGRFVVNRLGYGAMRLAGPGVWGPPSDPGEAISVLRSAVETGVNHIDTAQYYGPDVVNDLIRRALYPYGPGLAIVSKVGVRRGGHGRIILYNKPDELRQGILDNLASLRVEQLAAVNLRLVDGAPVDTFFDEQVTAMVRARDDGLIAGIGLSNITLEHLRRALEVTDIVCVQNLLNPADLSSMPVLLACVAEGIAFVPFFSLGAGAPQSNAVLGDPRVTGAAERLGVTPAQIALAWALELAPNVLVIPGTSSRVHLSENLGAQQVELDEQARRELSVGP
ncbi:MAG TPA: aldo/keto reductase [Acidimicrobiales bacterium]|nr:aldo/keto reductase [Acidimicrobiales bacterium]